ncbi:hypothetical protein D6810_00800 [Candidatus Dojkabacteria bacterium]|uniref:Uncharacterized protein n=1 Tax=Candidatus Dojkabacteria bacterium TaxID=2099670 RepID=A0A3M0YZG9_9BACT|nr:MAG: hypothetical protein D6810_00800 [Candidatus Dojkabacteria bacterium]
MIKLYLKGGQPLTELEELEDQPLTLDELYEYLRGDQGQGLREFIQLIAKLRRKLIIYANQTPSECAKQDEDGYPFTTYKLIKLQQVRTSEELKDLKLIYDHKQREEIEKFRITSVLNDETCNQILGEISKRHPQNSQILEHVKGILEGEIKSASSFVLRFFSNPTGYYNLPATFPPTDGFGRPVRGQLSEGGKIGFVLTGEEGPIHFEQQSSLNRTVWLLPGSDTSDTKRNLGFVLHEVKVEKVGVIGVESLTKRILGVTLACGCPIRAFLDKE